MWTFLGQELGILFIFCMFHHTWPCLRHSSLSKMLYVWKQNIDHSYLFSHGEVGVFFHITNFFVEFFALFGINEKYLKKGGGLCTTWDIFIQSKKKRSSIIQFRLTWIPNLKHMEVCKKITLCSYIIHTLQYLDVFHFEWMYKE